MNKLPKMNNKEVLLSCIQALSTDYVTDDYKPYLELAESGKKEFKSYLPLLKKVDEYHNYLENGETDCSELGLDILNTVLDIEDVDYNGDNLSYIEEVVIEFFHTQYSTTKMDYLERSQDTLGKIDKLRTSLDYTTPLSNIGLRAQYERLESDILNKRISRDCALDRLEDLETACFYAGDDSDELNLSNLRGLINITDL